MIDWQSRAKEYAAGLAKTGAIIDPMWLSAFEATPRHVFVPRYWALDEYNAPSHLIDGDDPEQRDEWLATVYSDAFCATQWTDGMITSSASLPSLVAAMLHLLDVRDGHQVLEIGTGTGYNAALLCHRVGDTRVVSVEIDPALVDEARDRLAGLGLEPLLIAGDGAAGAPEGAPYDRILSTCASPGVPAAWINQLADDGVIVAPFTFGGALATVTKTEPGVVNGRFDTEQAWFMPLRPADATGPEGLLVDLPDALPTAATHLGFSNVDAAALQDPDFRLWLCLHLPEGRLVPVVSDDMTTQTGLIVHTANHRAEYTADTGRVVQDDRRLWDTVEAAWRTWVRRSRPGRDRLGITATADGVQRVWLDSPDSDTAWPLPLETRASGTEAT